MLRNCTRIGLFVLAIMACMPGANAHSQHRQRSEKAYVALAKENVNDIGCVLRHCATPMAHALSTSISDRTAFTPMSKCAELLVPVAAAKAHLLPSPRLEVDLSDCLSPGEVVSSIEVKPLGNILLVQQRSSLVVVEPATGRKLWCRPFRETFDLAGKMVAGVRLSESVGWSMVASGMVENLGLVIIMQADKTAIQEDKSSANGLRWVFSDRIEAIQAATGHVLWQSDWQERTREGRPFWLIGMVDGLLVESPYLYNETQHKPMRLRSAATGNLLDPANPTDRAAIQKAAAHHANKPVLITSGPSVYSIDLLAGTSAYAGLGGAFQIVEPAVFPAQHRVVRFFRGDDDMVGHSNWPNGTAGIAGKSSTLIPIVSRSGK